MPKFEVRVAAYATVKVEAHDRECVQDIVNDMSFDAKQVTDIEILEITPLAPLEDRVNDKLQGVTQALLNMQKKPSA